MSDIEIRQAELSDFEAIDAFDVFSGSRQIEIQRNEIIVAVKDHLVVGYATFDQSFYLKPFIRYLCVSESFEGQGIANKLLDFIESMFTGKRLFSSTESNNFSRSYAVDNKSLIGNHSKTGCEPVSALLLSSSRNGSLNRLTACFTFQLRNP